MAKRYYKVEETVWSKSYKTEGVIKSLDIPKLEAMVSFSGSDGITMIVPQKFTEIDKLRKPKVVKSEVNRSKATFPMRSKVTNATKKESCGLDHAFEQVKEFHAIFNHLVSEVPTSVSYDLSLNRYKFMLEELDEFLLASDGKNKDGKSLDEIEKIAAQADAMIDLIYFALGTMVQLGVKPQPLMDIVQYANMSKLWADGKPHYHSVTNKVMKPEGWQDPAPYLEAEVMRQKANAILSSRK